MRGLKAIYVGKFLEQHVVLVSYFLSSHPTFRICNWLRNNLLWSVHYKRRHSQAFCHKTCISTKLLQPLFCQILFLYGKLWKLKNVFLDLYPIDLNNQRQNTTAFSRKKPDKKSLSQLHFKLPAKFKWGGMTSRLAAWPLDTCFKMAAADAEILGFSGD